MDIVSDCLEVGVAEQSDPIRGSTHHLSYEKGDPSGRDSSNNRNGHSDKTVLMDEGEVPIATPRDRNSTFEPAIVPKGTREESRLPKSPVAPGPTWRISQL